MVISDGKKKTCIKSEPDLFQRLILVAQTHTIDLQKVLSCELSAVPSSIARSDDSMKKDTKSQHPPPVVRLTNVVGIIVGMALIHMMKKPPKTFGELAQCYLDSVKKLFTLPNVVRVDVVFDMYDDDMSIKSSEHAIRQKTELGHEVHIRSANT